MTPSKRHQRAKSEAIAYFFAVAVAPLPALAYFGWSRSLDRWFELALFAIVAWSLALFTSIFPYLLFRTWTRGHAAKLSSHLLLGLFVGCCCAALIAVVPDLFNAPEPRPSFAREAFSFLKLTIPSGLLAAATYWWVMRMRLDAQNPVSDQG